MCCGYKNITHSTTTINRYRKIIEECREKIEAPELINKIDAAVLSVLIDVWSYSQKTCIILHLLFSNNLVKPAEVIKEAFKMPGIASVGNYDETMNAWNIIETAINYVMSMKHEAMTKSIEAESIVISHTVINISNYNLKNI